MTISPISLGNTFLSNNGGSVLSGLSSGLNTQSVINSIVAAQSAQISPLKDKITANTAQASALTTLQQLLTQLKAATSLIASPQSPDSSTNLWAINTSTITSNTTQSASNFINTTVTTGAPNGTYIISNVSQLATLSQQKTNAFTLASSSSAFVGGVGFAAGAVTIKNSNGVGTSGFTLTANESLDDVVSAFNNISSSTGITATAVKTSPTQYTLAFSSTATGAASDFDLTDPGEATGLSGLHINAAIAGLDASFSLNGVPITRPTNTISDLIPGVTLNLLQDTSTEPTASFTLKVAPDTGNIQKGIDNFALAYNAFLSFYAQQTQLGDDGTPTSSAILYSDTTLRSIYNQVTTQASTLIKGINSGPNKLQDVGISFTDAPASGTTPAISNVLSVDDSVLQSALLTNFSGVEKVFGSVLTASSSHVGLFKSENVSNVQNFTLDINQSGTSPFYIVDDPAVTPFVVASGAAGNQFNAGTITIAGPSGSADVTFTAGETLNQVAADFNAVNGTTGLTATVHQTATGSGVYQLVFTNTLTSDPVNFSLLDSDDVTADTSGVLSAQSATAYIASYTDGAGKKQHVNLTATSLGSGGVSLAAPATGDLAGLSLIYSSTGSESGISVNLTQGVADQITNFVASAVKSNTGLIASDQTALQTKNTTLQTQIGTITDQITKARQQLLQRFAVLEAAVARANSALNLLNAQQSAASS